MANLLEKWFQGLATLNGLQGPQIFRLWIFFIWGYLKDKVYRDNLKSVTELKEAEIRAIGPGVPAPSWTA